MENGVWGMRNGEWEWGMGNKKWEMRYGKWEMENGKSLICGNLKNLKNLSVAISDIHTFFQKRSDAKFKERNKLTIKEEVIHDT